jgi:hypothetical protein
VRPALGWTSTEPSSSFGLLQKSCKHAVRPLAHGPGSPSPRAWHCRTLPGCGHLPAHVGHPQPGVAWLRSGHSHCRTARCCLLCPAPSRRLDGAEQGRGPDWFGMFRPGARPALVLLPRHNSERVPLPTATWVLTRVTMAIGRYSLPHCLASRRQRDCSELM